MTASWSAPPYGFNRIQAWFARLIAANGRLPSDHRVANHPIIRAVCRRARVGQGQAFGGAEEAPSLTLAARDGDGQYAVGAEECSRRGSNKRMTKQGTKKMVFTIDKESPIQAVCPNWARTDLCGGRLVTAVPTANAGNKEAPHAQLTGVQKAPRHEVAGSWAPASQRAL
jgi:hypothetical protein